VLSIRVNGREVPAVSARLSLRDVVGGGKFGGTSDGSATRWRQVSTHSARRRRNPPSS